MAFDVEYDTKIGPILIAVSKESVQDPSKLSPTFLIIPKHLYKDPQYNPHKYPWKMPENVRKIIHLENYTMIYL